MTEKFPSESSKQNRYLDSETYHGKPCERLRNEGGKGKGWEGMAWMESSKRGCFGQLASAKYFCALDLDATKGWVSHNANSNILYCPQTGRHDVVVCYEFV